MCVTDGQTDEQNYDSQDGASLAASRGKNATSGYMKRKRRDTTRH